MMKRILIFAVVLSLLVPAAALAATEFSLGGYIKLDTLWDSGENTIGGSLAPARTTYSPYGQYHQGWLGMTAEGSRFNFTIKGPDVLGAKLTGFLEMDFEGTVSTAPLLNTSYTASNSYVPRLRHAMFRLNWPGDTELIMGQYWSMFCDFAPEMAEDNALQLVGNPIMRVPQIRLSQGFGIPNVGGKWTVSGLVADPTGGQGSTTIFPYGGGFTANSTTGGNSPGNALQMSNTGQLAETPQVQGQIKYTTEALGQAPYFGHPQPLTVEVTAGWQRNVISASAGTPKVLLLDETQPSNNKSATLGHGYISPWVVMGDIFIPVIPSNGPNLAGSVHLHIRPWIGQSPSSFGFAQANTTQVYSFDGVDDTWHESPFHHYGGFAEAQYYFTNQWFMNVDFGMREIFGINQGGNYISALAVNATTTNLGLELEPRSVQQVAAALWWRPIAALKFGLEYEYMQTKYLANLSEFGTTPKTATAATPYINPSDRGTEHRVEFVGFFYF
jgi:hypothetical protein